MQVKIVPGIYEISCGGKRQLVPGTMRLPVRRLEIGGRSFISMGIKLPKDQAGITEVIVDSSLNIVSERAQIPGQAKHQELLSTEPTLEALTRRVLRNQYNVFRGQRGNAEHNAITWPFADAHLGRVFQEKYQKLVTVSFRDTSVNIPAAGSPRGAVNGFGYRLPNDITEAGLSENQESCFLQGEVRLTDNQWFPALIVKHRIILDKGVLKRILVIENIRGDGVPFSAGEQPAFAIPKGQARAGVLFGIPASLLVKVDKGSLLPDLSRSPFCAVDQSPLAGLFNAHDEEGFFPLGDRFINQCFVGLAKNPVVRMMFPNLGWGVAVSPSAICDNGMINALRVCALPGNLGVVLGLRGNTSNPFDPGWNKYTRISHGLKGLTGSGMSIIEAGSRRTWGVEHRIEILEGK